jgi:hypothetical protein
MYFIGLSIKWINVLPWIVGGIARETAITKVFAQWPVTVANGFKPHNLIPIHI